MDNRDVVIGIIGYGYWGPNLCRNFFELDGVRLKYICDSSQEKLDEAGRRFPRVELATEIQTVLDDDEVEAVVMASSAVTHYPLAKRALLAGKHVMVEKPLSLEVEQGRELVDLAEKNGRILMVGHLLIYHPAVDYLKKYLDSGEAGEFCYIYSQRLNLGRLRRDENCLWSLAPHDISVMLYLFEIEPESVVARGASYLQDGLEDVVFCTLYFPGKKIGNLHVSWLDPHKTRKFTIVGKEKMLVFDDMSTDEKVRVFDKRAYYLDLELGNEPQIHYGDQTVPFIRWEEPLRKECAHFRDCVREEKKPLSDGEQGLRVVKVLSAATKSLELNGQPVALEKA